MSNNDIANKLDEVLQKLDHFEKSILEYGGDEQTTEVVGDIEAEWRFEDEKLAVESLNFGSVEELRSSTELVHRGFKHSWYCNFLNQCKTTYRGHCWVINPRNGRILECNLIQSATRKDHGIEWWDTSPYGRVVRDRNEIYYGFGEERHRSRHVSSCANFYGDWGSVSWKWTSFA